MPLSEEPFQIAIPSENFETWDQLKHELIAFLNTRDHYKEVVVTGVPTSQAKDFLHVIDERIPSRKSYNSRTLQLVIISMPTPVHDAIQAWIVKELYEWREDNMISRAEMDLLNVQGGTTLDFNTGPLSGSSKEPGFFFQVNGQALPTVAFEAGWTKSAERLREDVDTLLTGGNGLIKIVVTVKWHKDGNRVSGNADLYQRTKNGVPRRMQSQRVFPVPHPHDPDQSLRVRRRVLFGSSLIPGRDPDEYLCFSIERLRSHATRSLSFMGLLPASDESD